MIFRATFKDSSAVRDGIYLALKESSILANADPYKKKETAEEKAARKLLNEQSDEISEQVNDAWMYDEEYLTIEFDTDKGTAVVVNPND